jgi:hypothetical protein
MSEVNPYQAQIDNVKWSVGSDGTLVIEVDLYGDGFETKAGNSMVARSAGWQEVDRERWAGYAFSVSLIRRGPEWLERAHERALRENEAWGRHPAEVRRERRSAGYAARAGMTEEEWLARMERKSLDECWKEAAKTYQVMYGVRLPGYTGRVRLVRRRAKGAGKRKHVRTAKEAK